MALILFTTISQQIALSRITLSVSWSTARSNFIGLPTTAALYSRSGGAAVPSKAALWNSQMLT